MIRRIFLMFLFLAVTGCSGTARYKMTGTKTYELEVVDDGVKNLIHSTSLYEDWENEAVRICPQGYTVVTRTYYTEKAFNTARLVGTIACQ